MIVRINRPIYGYFCINIAKIPLHNERVPEGLQRVKQQCMMVKSEEQCANYYLTKGITKESEMADTEGSTATTSMSNRPQLATHQENLKHT